MMQTLILYSTLGCHLCEQALALVTPLLPADCRIQEVDISDCDQLLEQYGVRIPVLKRESDGAELGWPFDQQQFMRFIRV